MEKGEILRIKPEHFHSTGCPCCDVFPPRCHFCGETCTSGLELSHELTNHHELFLCDACIKKATEPAKSVPVYLVASTTDFTALKNPVLTQLVLDLTYSRQDRRMIRFNLEENRFECLFPHKWRTAAEGGGWDENGPWQERWEPIPV